MQNTAERITEITETCSGGLDPMHEAIDADKLMELIAAMEMHGWVGAPVVCHGEQALTGSHRMAAAREAGHVPVPRVDVSELCEAYGTDWDEVLAAHCDDWYWAAAALRDLLPREVVTYLGYDVNGVA